MQDLEVKVLGKALKYVRWVLHFSSLFFYTAEDHLHCTYDLVLIANMHDRVFLKAGRPLE